MARKRVDISEAYEMFQHLERTCVVCFDIVGLMPINEISHEAGDKAILEAARRIDAIAEDDMLVMRIGGDEFALLPGKEDLLKAEDLMKKYWPATNSLSSGAGRKSPYPFGPASPEYRKSICATAICLPKCTTPYN